MNERKSKISFKFSRLDFFLSITGECCELGGLNPNATTATNTIGFIELAFPLRCRYLTDPR